MEMWCLSEFEYKVPSDSSQYVWNTRKPAAFYHKSDVGNFHVGKFHHKFIAQNMSLQ